jgi:hypothetical protein
MSAGMSAGMRADLAARMRAVKAAGLIAAAPIATLLSALRQMRRADAMGTDVVGILRVSGNHMGGEDGCSQKNGKR